MDIVLVYLSIEHELSGGWLMELDTDLGLTVIQGLPCLKQERYPSPPR